MKPHFFDRLLLAVVCILGMALGLAFLLLAIGVFSLDVLRIIVDNFAAHVGSFNFSLIIGAKGLLVFLVFLRLIIGFNKRSKSEAPAPAAVATVVNSDFGSIQVSLAAIDAMIQRHCRSNNKVREAISVVSTRDNGVAINLKLVLLSEANVPETTAELQKSLKEYVEGLTGITVKDISMMVINAPMQQGLQK